MKRYGWILVSSVTTVLSLVALLATGCSYDLTSDPAGGGAVGDGDAGGGGTAQPGGACIPNQAAFCDCAGGSQGVTTCTSSASWGACDCSVTVGSPGGTVDAGVDTGVDTGTGGVDTGGGGTTYPTNWSVTCETNRYWQGYNFEDDGEYEMEGGSTMAPGQDCAGCHNRGEGPRLAVGGTVFLGLHDDDDCYGASGVTVRLTGNDGRSVDLHSNTTGNFLLERANIALPYTASVITADGVRAMVTPQTDLNCNSCHSIAGAQGAPGRVWVPTLSAF